MKNITHEEIRQIFDYNPKTGDMIWKQIRGRVKGGDVAGCLDNATGYIRIGINGGYCLAHRLVWLFVYGYFPEHGLDHINRNKTDNRIENLREASQQCNLRNCKIHKNNKSGVKGVSWHSDRAKWRVAICVNKKNSQLGYFDDFYEAVCHRLAAEQCLNWPDCDKSSSAFKYIKKLKGGY